jgi:hypothetical protein
LLLWESLLANEVLIRHIESFLLSAHLRAANGFEELCALNVSCATSFPKADHLLCLLCAEAKGLQLRLLRCSILRSLRCLNARLLRSLCRLYAACLCHIDTLSAGQLGCLCRLHSGCFLSAEALRTSKLSCLSLLASKLCATILTKHLGRLLECLLRALCLNAGKAIKKVALCQRFLNRLTGATEGTSAYSLRRASAALLFKLLTRPAGLLIDNRLHVRRHVFLHRSASEALGGVECKLASLSLLEPSEGLYALLFELCPTKLKRSASALSDILASLNVSCGDAHCLRQTSNALTCDLTGHIVRGTDISRQCGLTLPLERLVLAKRHSLRTL